MTNHDTKEQESLRPLLASSIEETRIPFSKLYYEDNPKLYIIDDKLQVKIDKFFEDYQAERWYLDEGRLNNLYGTDKYQLKPRKLRKTFNAFLESGELAEYLSATGNFTLEEAVDVGIDKFLASVGIKKHTKVDSWRTHNVKLDICPDCRNEFAPVMIRTNGGLCKKCVKKYSFEGLSAFVEEQMTIPRDEASLFVEPENIFLNVMILFYKDNKFRSMFLKDTEFINDLINRNKARKSRNKDVDVEAEDILSEEVEKDE